jgi:hypothetical protein
MMMRDGEDERDAPERGGEEGEVRGGAGVGCGAEVRYMRIGQRAACLG